MKIGLGLGLTSQHNHAAGFDYFVDSVSGNDGNSGTSPALAWKTVAEPNGKVGGLWGKSLGLNAADTWASPLTAVGRGVSLGMYNSSGKLSAKIPGGTLLTGFVADAVTPVSYSSFESGSPDAFWTSAGTDDTTTPAYAGTHSRKFAASGSNVNLSVVTGGSNYGEVTTALRVSSTSTASSGYYIHPIVFQGGGVWNGANEISCVLAKDATGYYLSLGRNVVITVDQRIAVDTWYIVRLCVTCNNGTGNAHAELYVNGTQVKTLTGLTLAAQVNQVAVGNYANNTAAYTINVDELNFYTSDSAAAMAGAYYASLAPAPSALLYNMAYTTQQLTKAALATVGDWYYDSADARLYIYSPSNTPTTAIAVPVAVTTFSQPFSINSVWNRPLTSYASVAYASTSFPSFTAALGNWPGAGWSVVTQALVTDPLVNIYYNINSWANVANSTWARSGNNSTTEAAIMAGADQLFGGNEANYYSSITPYPTRTGPTVAYHHRTDAPWSLTARVPASMVPPPDADGHCSIFQPDGSVLETFATILMSNGDLVCGFASYTDPKGLGTGLEGGRRAPMMPNYAGIIRNGELTSGVINHALGVVLGPEALTASYVSPAITMDSNTSIYSGALPIGTLLAIPSTVNLTGLGLTTAQGKILAKAAQQYGMYNIDTAGSDYFLLATEHGASDVPAWSSPLAADLAIIMAQVKKATVTA